MITSISLVGAAIFPQTSARGVKQTWRIEHRADVSKSTVDTIDRNDVLRGKENVFWHFDAKEDPFLKIKRRLYIHIYKKSKASWTVVSQIKYIAFILPLYKSFEIVIVWHWVMIDVKTWRDTFSIQLATL